MATKSLPIDKYLKADLFAEIGLNTATPEQRVQFLESFNNVVQKRITMHLMRELDENQKDQLETAVSKNENNPQAMMDYMMASIPNFNRIMEEEIAQFKKELIDRFKSK